MEVAGMVGEVFAVNTVIDEARRLCFVNAGESAASHAEAVRFIEGSARVELPRRYPVVVTSSAGHPLDATYYQTVKGMVGALGILEQGGDLFTVSSCSEGLGSADFRACQARLAAEGPVGFEAAAAGKERAEVDEWQTAMLVKAGKAGTMHLFTEGIGPAERALTCVRVVEGDPGAAVAECARRRGARRIAVIPEGPYVVPVAPS
jgi:nickel-dependent lactate racemase